MEQPDMAPSVVLRRLVDGYQISQAIYVVALGSAAFPVGLAWLEEALLA